MITRGQRLRAFLKRHYLARQMVEQQRRLDLGRSLAFFPARGDRLIAQDDFDRADGLSLGNTQTGQAWAVAGVNAAFGITSGRAYRTDTTAARGCMTVPTHQANVAVSAEIEYGANNENAELVARFTDINNYILAGLERNTIGGGGMAFCGSFQANVWGGYVFQNDQGPAWTIGQVYSLVLVLRDATIELFIDGTLAGSGSLAFNQAATRHGIGALHDAPDGAYGARFNNFKIIGITP